MATETATVTTTMTMIMIIIAVSHYEGSEHGNSLASLTWNLGDVLHCAPSEFAVELPLRHRPSALI